MAIVGNGITVDVNTNIPDTTIKPVSR